MITDPWFYAAAVPALLIIGISKGGLGGGLAIVGVPLLAMVVDPRQAAAILLPILCVMDFFGVLAYRGSWDRPNMRILLPAAVVGIVIGALTFRYLNADAIRLLIGVISIGFVANYLAGKFRSVPAEPVGPNIWKGGFWGGVAGFVSFVAHAGAPPLSVYLLPQRLSRTVFMGTSVLFFIVVNYVKLVPYTLLGQFDGRNLMTSLVLMPLAPIGIWMGVWAHNRISEKVFYIICYTAVAVAGFKLLYEGISALFS